MRVPGCAPINPPHELSLHVGQVVALFIVGLGEYAVVWLGTDWDKEIQYSIERNRDEAKRRRLHEGTGAM